MWVKNKIIESGNWSRFRTLLYIRRGGGSLMDTRVVVHGKQWVSMKIWAQRDIWYFLVECPETKWKCLYFAPVRGFADGLWWPITATLKALPSLAAKVSCDPSTSSFPTHPTWKAESSDALVAVVRSCWLPSSQLEASTRGASSGLHILNIALSSSPSPSLSLLSQHRLLH